MRVLLGLFKDVKCNLNDTLKQFVFNTTLIPVRIIYVSGKKYNIDKIPNQNEIKSKFPT